MEVHSLSVEYCKDLVKERFSTVRSFLLKLLIVSCFILIAIPVAFLPQHTNATAMTTPTCEITTVGGIGGWVRTMTVAGTVAYVGEANALTILDMQIVDRPTVLSRLLFAGGVADVQIAGHRAYLALGRAGFSILDVSDPEQPQIIGSMPTIGHVINVSVEDDTAYIATRDRGLIIVDVSAPRTPVILGTHATSFGDTLRTRSLHVKGGIAYVLTGSTGSAGGVHLVNVSDPAHPVILSAVGSRSSSESVNGFDVKGQYLYLARNTGLAIFDISTPSAPQLVGTYTQSSLYGIDVEQDRAYVNNAVGNMDIIDVSVPSSPQLLGIHQLPTIEWQPLVVGSVAYIVMRETGVQLVDVSDPTNPTMLHGGYRLAEVRAAQIVGSRAYLATGLNGLQVLDISTPAQPQPLFRAQDSWSSYAVHVAGNRVFSAGYDTSYRYKSGVQIFDISDPAQLQILGTADVHMHIKQITERDNLLYIAGSRGLLIIDVSQPANPVEIGAIQRDNTNTIIDVADIQLSGNIAYLGGRSGIMAIDVSVPSQPIVVWKYGGTDVIGIHVAKNILYDLSNDVLRSTDVSDPNRAINGLFLLPSPAEALHVVGNFAYTAGYGVSILDISDPNEPEPPVCARSAFPIWGVDITVEGERVAVSSVVDGFHILRAVIASTAPTASPVTETPHEAITPVPSETSIPTSTPVEEITPTPVTPTTVMPEPSVLPDITPTATTQPLSEYAQFLPLISH
jgi:hypothetical protein